MTSQTERFAHKKAGTTTRPAHHTPPRGGSYVTLPAARNETPRTEGTYVTTPGGHAGNGEKVQGRYVTLHTPHLDETEGSYTRRG
jgi:hypothetical protein